MLCMMSGLRSMGTEPSFWPTPLLLVVVSVLGEPEGDDRDATDGRGG